MIKLTEFIPLPRLFSLDMETNLLLINDCEETSPSIVLLLMTSLLLFLGLPVFFAFEISRNRLTFSLSLTPKIY